MSGGKSKDLKNWRLVLAFALAGAIFGAVFARTALMGGLEALTQDLRAGVLQAPQPDHPEIVLVTIGEGDLARFAYRSPIDRGFLADLVRRIGAEDPRAIGFDILLDAPTEPAKDAVLRQALAETAAKLVVAHPPDLQSPQKAAFMDAMTGLAARGDASLDQARRDGVVRSVAQPAQAPPLFAVALAAKAQTAPRRLATFVIRFAPGIQNSERPWPFRTIAAGDLLQTPASVGWLRNKVVILGAAVDDRDLFVTPLRFAGPQAEVIPGMVVHAFIAADLMAPRRITPAPLWLEGAIAALAGLAGAMLGLALRRWATRLGALCGGIALYAVAAFANAGATDVLTPIIAPIFAAAAAFAAASAYGANHAQRERAGIDLMFRHYLAPAIVDRLQQQPGQVRLAGERREISVLFTDVEGFTAMVEALEPEQLSAAINDYFDVLIPIVTDHGGLIDKIVGDSLHVLFGAPDQDDRHAARAIACARAVHEAASAWRLRAKVPGWGRTRIGVHAGPATLGSFGGRQRLDYTAHGDVINFAARIEAANKALGATVLVSGAAWERAGADRGGARRVGLVHLRGARAPLELFALCGASEPYGQAVSAADRGDVEDAIAIFSALEAAGDGLASLQLARLRAGSWRDPIDLKAG